MSILAYKLSKDLSIDLNSSISWIDKEKLFKTVTLASGDGAHNIDVSSIENISMIIITSSDEFSVVITKNAVTSEMAVKNLFILQPSEVDRDLITQISITAINATSSDFTVAVYGETAS